MKKKAPVIVVKAGVLDVRYPKIAGTQAWFYGTFRARLDDGSIEFIEARNGAIRTMLPSRGVEFRIFGPRGGEKWVSAEQAERPMARPT